ncbi:MAG: arginine N-succinyltransferase [Sphingomonadaceae bacterium]|nr:arginine N-succinyltransferase [Sphingomonadaceae bacterium]
MSWQIRPICKDDLEQAVALAQLTGPGFTNIPSSRDAYAERIAWSEASFARTGEAPANDLYLMVLEDTRNGALGGTVLLFGQVGTEWPFYSYLVSEHAQHSRMLGRTIRAELLHLVTDNGGASEVGGLFLHPELRRDRLGRFIARSRYLFIAQHRARFGPRFVSELRGWLTPEGQSPFWDAIGRHFFDMDFIEADRFNASHGNQFIAELMPKYPIYSAMLPAEARAVIGRPHDSGLPAMRLLEAEGFHFEGYVDIFDGGPTMNVRTDQIRTVRDSRVGPYLGRTDEGAGLICAAGKLTGFRAWRDVGLHDGEGWRLVDGGGLARGEEVRCVAL